MNEMTAVTDLSPAARAVLEAAVNTSEHLPYEHDIAAALRAAADQVVPPALEKEFFDRNPALSLQIKVEIRRELLAIAAELEAI